MCFSPLTCQRSWHLSERRPNESPQSFLLNSVVFCGLGFFNGVWFADCGFSQLNSPWQCTHFRALTLQGSLRQFDNFLSSGGLVWTCFLSHQPLETQGSGKVHRPLICPAAKLKGCGKGPGSVWNMFPEQWTPSRVLCPAWGEWPCPEPAWEGTSQLGSAMSSLSKWKCCAFPAPALTSQLEMSEPPLVYSNSSCEPWVIQNAHPEF